MRRRAMVLGALVAGVLLTGCSAADVSGVRLDEAGNPMAINCGTWISEVVVSDADTGRDVWAVRMTDDDRREVDDVGHVVLGHLPTPGWREITPYEPEPRPVSWRFEITSAASLRPTTIVVPDDAAAGVVYRPRGRESLDHFENESCNGIPAWALFGPWVFALAVSCFLVGVVVLADRRRARNSPPVIPAHAGMSPSPAMIQPPAWYPDPRQPGQWIYWNGWQWFRPLPPPPPTPPRSKSVGAGEASRSAFAQVRARPRTYAAVGTILLVSIAALYATATFGNGLVFGYDFFTDAAPSDVADTVAVVSLLVMAVLVSAACAWTFGAFAALGMGEPSARAAFRRSAGPVLRDCWIAVPGFVVAVLAVMSVVLAPFVVGPLATRAVGRVARAPRGTTLPRIGRGMALAIVPMVVSVLVWAIGAIAAAFPSPPTWLAGVFFVGLVSTSAFAMAWVAVANAAIVLGES